MAVDGERWARGDHADYDTVKEVLVLTGNPEARQGTNTMRGDRVVFYVDTDLIEVERVKGVLESKGKEPGQKKPSPGAPGEGALMPDRLLAEGLVKTYRRRRVVDGVRLEVAPGEIVGLLGPNGAGKTTTFNMVVGSGAGGGGAGVARRARS